MKVAIMGGAFNPPHLGHLFFANEVRQQLGYDKIIFIPTAISPHKLNHTNAKDIDRLNMLEIATESYSWAMVSKCDIMRGGVTRSIDTVSDIYNEFEINGKLGFVIGNDLVENFYKWKDVNKFVNMIDLIVGSRDQKDIELNFDHKKIVNRIFPLSSSEIRERVNKGLDIDFLLPKEVINYIQKNGLYKT